MQCTSTCQIDCLLLAYQQIRQMASGAAELTKSWIKRAREVTRIGTLWVYMHAWHTTRCILHQVHQTIRVQWFHTKVITVSLPAIGKWYRSADTLSIMFFIFQTFLFSRVDVWLFNFKQYIVLLGYCPLHMSDHSGSFTYCIFSSHCPVSLKHKLVNSIFFFPGRRSRQLELLETEGIPKPQDPERFSFWVSVLYPWTFTGHMIVLVY